MRAPIYVRPLTDAEQQIVQAGLRSSDAFTLRRCQILLASADGQRAPQIARTLGCDDQTVLNAIRAFDALGVDCLTRGSTRPRHVPHAAFDDVRRERLRDLLHQPPRAYGKPTSVWTLALAADVSVEHVLTATRVSHETIRAAQHQARNGVVMALTGRPSTNRNHRRSRRVSSGSTQRVSSP